MTTDANGEEENLIKVHEEQQDGSWNEVFKKDDFESNSYHSIEECFSTSKCFRFVMFDRARDGMCCEDGDGSYKLTWAGRSLVYLCTYYGFVHFYHWN